MFRFIHPILVRADIPMVFPSPSFENYSDHLNVTVAGPGKLAVNAVSVGELDSFPVSGSTIPSPGPNDRRIIQTSLPTGPGIIGHLHAPLPADDSVNIASHRSHVVAPTSVLYSDTPASSSRTSVGEMTRNNGYSQSVQSVPRVMNSPGANPQASTRTNKSTLQIAKGKAPPIIMPIPPPSIETLTNLTLGTQTMTASSKSQYIFPSSKSPVVGSTVTLGSDNSTAGPALQTSGTYIFLESRSSSLLLPVQTPIPGTSKNPPFLTVNEQTARSDSLGQYFIDGQTLTPGGVITVSGTTVSLIPNKSDVIVGSTKFLGPSVTATIGSGSNGSEVQKFTGSALGVGDGLWSSSTTLLLAMAVLLWL